MQMLSLNSQMRMHILIRSRRGPTQLHILHPRLKMAKLKGMTQANP